MTRATRGKVDWLLHTGLIAIVTVVALHVGAANYLSATPVAAPAGTSCTDQACMGGGPGATCLHQMSTICCQNVYPGQCVTMWCDDPCPPPAE